MKIYRKNGTIIEMTVEEYKTAFLKKDRTEFIEEYKQSSTPDTTTKPKHKSDNMAEYMREYRKLGAINAIHKRKSSCLKWKRTEDKIIKENVHNLNKAKKLLKGRTLIAVYSRRQKLKELGKIKDYNKPSIIRKPRSDIQNDGRYKMMKYIAKELKDITTVRPQMPINEARKQAFDRYRKHKMGDNHGSK